MLARWRRASGPALAARRRGPSGPELPGPPASDRPVPGTGGQPAGSRTIGSPLEAGQVGVMVLRLVAMLAGLALIEIGRAHV